MTAAVGQGGFVDPRQAPTVLKPLITPNKPLPTPPVRKPPDASGASAPLTPANGGAAPSSPLVHAAAAKAAMRPLGAQIAPLIGTARQIPVAPKAQAAAPQAPPTAAKRSKMERDNPRYFAYAKESGPKAAAEKMTKQLAEAQKAMENETQHPKRFNAANVQKGQQNIALRLLGKANARNDDSQESSKNVCPAHKLSFKNCQVGIADTIGTDAKRGMEDEHLAQEFSFTIGGKQHTAQLFGVFDGHGGREVATKVKDEITERLKTALEQNKTPINDEMIGNALTQVLMEMGEQFSVENLANPSGTCANIAFVLNGSAYVANVGDSRAIVVDTNGKVTQASEDAKPAESRFLEGIKERGGYVGESRVGGKLAPARDIGFQTITGVISRPKITKIPLESGSQLCLACDGVWDVATSAQIGKTIADFKAEGKSPDQMARNIALAAVGSGSSDNISCMVISMTPAASLQNVPPSPVRPPPVAENAPKAQAAPPQRAAGPQLREAGAAELKRTQADWSKVLEASPKFRPDLSRSAARAELARTGDKNSYIVNKQDGNYFINVIPKNGTGNAISLEILLNDDGKTLDLVFDRSAYSTSGYNFHETSIEGLIKRYNSLSESVPVTAPARPPEPPKQFTVEDQAEKIKERNGKLVDRSMAGNEWNNAKVGSFILYKSQSGKEVVFMPKLPGEDFNTTKKGRRFPIDDKLLEKIDSAKKEFLAPEKIVDDLLQQNNVDGLRQLISDNKDQPFLEHIIRTGNVNLMKFYLSIPEGVNDLRQQIIANKGNESLLLDDFIRTGNADLVKIYLSIPEGAEDVNEGEYSNVKPLYVACSMANEEILVDLIAAGAKIDDAIMKRANPNFKELLVTADYINKNTYDSSNAAELRDKLQVKNEFLIGKSSVFGWKSIQIKQPDPLPQSRHRFRTVQGGKIEEFAPDGKQIIHKNFDAFLAAHQTTRDKLVKPGLSPRGRAG